MEKECCCNLVRVIGVDDKGRYKIKGVNCGGVGSPTYDLEVSLPRGRGVSIKEIVKEDLVESIHTARLTIIYESDVTREDIMALIDASSDGDIQVASDFFGVGGVDPAKVDLEVFFAQE